MSSKITIAGTGLDGLLGTRIHALLSDYFNFVDLNVRIMDVTDKEQVDLILEKTEFDIFLHLAAYTNVDLCEENKELAYKINVEGTRNIFNAVSKKDKKMIFMSTGFVFDGEKPPYNEESTPNPVSYYGETKLISETDLKDRAMIVRIDYPYGSSVRHKKDIVESIVDTLKGGAPMKGVVDQIFTPTYIDDIANALKYLCEHFSPEVYHIVGSDSLSGYDLIIEICKEYDLDSSKVEKTTYDEFYKDRAKRPKKSVMISHKNNFYQMKTFREGLKSLSDR